MWQSLGYFDFSILHTYLWYLQKVALKKLWKETKINQDHPVRNNCHSSYTFLGLTFFSHKWFQFTVVLQSVSWKKYRPHEWREDFTCTKAQRFFFCHRSSPRALMSTAHLNIWKATEISHSLIGSKAYHVTCSPESQPTTNKKYGRGVVESIKWSLRKNSTILWRSLQATSGRRKTCHCCCRRGKDQQWVRWASGLCHAVKRRAVIILKYCCDEDFNPKSQ